MLTERRTDTRPAWDKIAPRYDRYTTPTHLWLGNEGLRRSGLHQGMRFIDVAAGTGALSIPAARLGARVLATDQSPVMLELLKRRALSEGLHVETRVMDGHALELDDDCMDIAGSQFGVMLFPDMPKGIREMVRVVRPGGRVLVTAFGNPQHVEFLSFLMAAVQSVRPAFEGPPKDPPLLEFQLANPERLDKELSAAGLKGVQVESITETLEFPTGQTLWDCLVSSNPVVERILGNLGLTEEERAAIKEALDRMVSRRAGPNGVAKLTSPINIGVGTK